MDSPNGGEHVNPGTGEVTTTGGALPATVGHIPSDVTANMPLALRIYFDDNLYNRCKQVATIMAKAEGFTPRHLINKTEACFAVTTTALETNVSPFFLAQNCYQTPGGQIGYTTKAYQAIVESSGLLRKAPGAEYIGDWTKVIGKFAIKQGKSGKDYAAPTWTRKDAEGLAIKITFDFKDRDEPEVFEMLLIQAYPLNSTLWATDPKTQMYYLACRRGLNLKRSGALAGARHIDDLNDAEAAPDMKEINPRPEKSGDAGLDEFATDASPTETVVEETDQAAPGDDPAKETVEQEKPEAADETKAKGKGKDEPITLWINADEPARPMKGKSAAVHVLRCEIKEAKTPALAQAVFNQNMGLIATLDKKTGDSLEADLNKRLEENGTSGGSGTLV